MHRQRRIGTLRKGTRSMVAAITIVTATMIYYLACYDHSFVNYRSQQISFHKQRTSWRLKPIAERSTKHVGTDETNKNSTTNEQYILSNQQRQISGSENISSSAHVKEVHHIAYIKTHKTGSSTLQNILFRFGMRKGLTFVLPVIGNYLENPDVLTSIYKPLIIPPPYDRTFDIVCSHAIFNYTVYRYYMPADTVYMASVREPISRLVSSFFYYQRVFPLDYLSRIPGPVPFLSFINDPARYEPKDPILSRTNNRMTIDFGFTNLQSSLTKLDQYLSQLDETLDLVLVVECFDQSLVLFRRRLGWNLKDILYIKKNVQALYFGELNLTLTDVYRQKAKEFLKWDYVVYNHYRNVMERKIKDAGKDFEAEVTHFKTIRERLETYCLQRANGPMTVNSSRWNEEFQITLSDCLLITMQEVPFTEQLRMRHRAETGRKGINKHFMDSIPSFPITMRQQSNSGKQQLVKSSRIIQIG